jgi:hypothetical protein
MFLISFGLNSFIDASLRLTGRMRTVPSYLNPVRLPVTSLPNTGPTLVSFHLLPIPRHTAFLNKLRALSTRHSILLPATCIRSIFGHSRQVLLFLVRRWLTSVGGCRIQSRDVNTELVEKHRKTLLTKLEGYERILSKQKYLAGDVRSIQSIHLSTRRPLTDIHSWRNLEPYPRRFVPYSVWCSGRKTSTGYSQFSAECEALVGGAYCTWFLEGVDW